MLQAHENENEVESQSEGTMQDALHPLPYAAGVPCSTIAAGP